MNTARTATLLTLFFALMCVIQISLIARTLDKTRIQLSNQSTGAINSLNQVDRNLDQFIDTLVVFKSSSSDPVAAEKAIENYRFSFDVFWGITSIFNLRSPGLESRLPAVDGVLSKVNHFLEKNDNLINTDPGLSNADVDRIYAESRYLSDLFHDLSHEYFLVLSKFSDEVKHSTQRIYWAFLFFAFMLVCSGTIATYSLMRANQRSIKLVKQSNLTQERLTQVVSELRSGKLESKAKDSFLAAASHDLRQPLHALGLFLGALEKHVQPAGRSTMEKAQQSSIALTRLLSSLLDLSRLDAGVVKVVKKDFALSSLVKTLEQEFQNTAHVCNMRLDFKSSEEIVYTDRLLLDRVLRNLIENALTHSRGTVLTISYGKVKDKLAITVSDDGIGIPENKQHDIFSEYYQIGNPERDRSKGLGIGLSIVKRLSELLDFELNFQSEKNSGCAFTLHVASGVLATQLKIDLPASSPNHFSDKGMLIAFIEDELEIREGMEIMLGTNGYDIITAESATALIATLEQETLIPDLLITDYRLRKNQTGTDAIKRISDYLGNDIPAIIVTGDTSPNRVKEATLSGFTLLHKPVEPSELIASIDKLMQKIKH